MSMAPNCSWSVGMREVCVLSPGLTNNVADSAPANCGDGAEVVDALLRIVGVIDEHRCPAEVRARHGTVVPAIDGVVTVVAHHKEGACGYNEWPPRVEA